MQALISGAVNPDDDVVFRTGTAADVLCYCGTGTATDSRGVTVPPGPPVSFIMYGAAVPAGPLPLVSYTMYGAVVPAWVLVS